MSTAGLLDEVRADPAAPLRAAVCVPGGYGKSALLGELERVDDRLLLVDDAHRLDDARRSHLRAQPERPDARIGGACRSWPRPPRPAALHDLLRRRRPPPTTL